jgi:hypothetical protein
MKYFIIFLCFFATGCVAHVPIDEQIPSLEYKNNDRLVVSVVDNRQRVKEGKPKDFIGVAHGVFGIPVDWHIKNVLDVEEGDKERNLSQWLQYRIVKGLEKSGWDVVSVDLDMTPNSNQVMSILNENKCEKMLIFLVNEWYFSINLNWVSAFNFDTNTTVFVNDIKNGEIFSKNFTERDVIEESASESAQNNILRAYRAQIIQILNDEEVKKSLIKLTHN